jgi:Ca2+-binding RTX toxin-like protein
LAGTLDGGGGTNTLNYAGYLGNVTVDLPLHLASLVNKMNPNSVFNIQNVQGSNGNDVIVGDANPNVFVGGTGRNLIIGGNGSDNIIGGGGDNILISGTTLWDANLPDLMLIMHEWMRMDLTFRQRVVDILTGGIIVPKNVPASVLKGTGVNLLPEISVLPDAPAAPDTLAGGAGQNWFFFDFDDIITNFKTGPNGDIRLLD